MQNLHKAHSATGKAISPSSVTCPHCGSPVNLLRAASRGRKARPISPNVRRRARSVLLGLRGALLWFSLVFITMGVLAAVAGQSILPASFGAGLLAIYAVSGLLMQR